LTLPPILLGLEYLRVQAFDNDLVFLAQNTHYEVVIGGPVEATQDVIEDEFILDLKLI
jgi:hypothetical protein